MVSKEKPSVTKKPSRPVTPKKPKETTPKKEPKQTKPAMDPENREQQLVNLAVQLAEKQLIDGTAAPSVINHFLKIASKRETLEREILERQSKLIEAKAKQLGKGSETEELARAAIEAMKTYKGSDG